MLAVLAYGYASGNEAMLLARCLSGIGISVTLGPVCPDAVEQHKAAVVPECWYMGDWAPSLGFVPSLAILNAISLGL
jgi:hypothetical protein